MKTAILNHRVVSWPGWSRVVLMLAAWTVLSCASSRSAADELAAPTQQTFSTAYAAVWKQAAGESRIASTDSMVEFWAEKDYFEQQGFRLVDFETGGMLGHRRFVGLWHEVPAEARSEGDASRLLVDVPLASVDLAIANQAPQGYRVVDLEVYSDDAGRLAALVMHPGSGNHEVEVDLSAGDFFAANTAHLGRGYRLIDLESYILSGESRFAALWIQDDAPAPQPIASTDLSWENVQELTSVFSGGHHVADLEIKSWFVCGEKTSAFTVLWQEPAAATSVSFPIDWDDLEAARSDPPGTQQHAPVSWLLNDVELLWHAPGAIESALGLDHDGPLTPPDED